MSNPNNPEYLSREDQLRIEALTKSIANRPIGNGMSSGQRESSEKIVADALAFFAFLTGDKT